jgi:hypothetical protein
MADTGDEERSAKQSILLELNGRVHEAAKLFESADTDRDLWDFTCECGASDCRVSVSLTLDEYEALREGGEPVLAGGHEVQRAAKARETARGLRADSAALQAQAELQRKRAKRNTRPA